MSVRRYPTSNKRDLIRPGAEMALAIAGHGDHGGIRSIWLKGPVVNVSCGCGLTIRYYRHDGPVIGPHEQCRDCGEPMSWTDLDKPGFCTHCNRRADHRIDRPCPCRRCGRLTTEDSGVCSYGMSCEPPGGSEAGGAA